jgi:hypothetical protein
VVDAVAGERVDGQMRDDRQPIPATDESRPGVLADQPAYLSRIGECVDFLVQHRDPSDRVTLRHPDRVGPAPAAIANGFGFLTFCWNGSAR